MKIKIECDSISQIETKRDSNKVEITLTNPTIEEYEDVQITDILYMIGREETNELMKHQMNEYLEELSNEDILNHYSKVIGIMDYRNILVTKESI